MLSERDLKVSRYTWVTDPPGGLARWDVLIQGDMSQEHVGGKVQALERGPGS